MLVPEFMSGSLSWFCYQLMCFFMSNPIGEISLGLQSYLCFEGGTGVGGQEGPVIPEEEVQREV